MFHLSRKTDYGLILILELLQRKKEGITKPVSLTEIAKKYCISFFFLQKIARELREKGFIKAERGKEGGYSLIKNENTVTLHEVFSALEGSVSVISCFSNNAQIPGIEKKCNMPVHRGLADLNTELNKILKNIRLTDFFTIPEPLNHH